MIRRILSIIQSLPVPFEHRRRARLGKLGRACVERELAWSHAAGADLGVYERLISTGSLRMSGIAGCREDHAKQIWQRLTLELGYRNMRSLSVAG